MPSLEVLRDICGSHRVVLAIRRGSAASVLQHVFAECVVLCLEDSPELGAIDGLRMVSYETLYGVRRHWAVGINPLFDQLWSTVAPTLSGRDWRVVSFDAALDRQQWADSTGSALVGPPRELVRHLNQKPTLFAILDQLGLPRVNGEWASPAHEPFSHWRDRFGSPLVMQLAWSNSGRGTAIVQTQADWDAAIARFEHAQAWLAPFHGHRSVNINALALSTGSVAAYPSVQLTGFECLGLSAGAYCGNDYTATSALPRDVLDEIRVQAIRVGDVLAEMGFHGLFGLDLVISDIDGRPRAVDLNPRWQGSTGLLGQGQRMAGRPNLPATAVAVAAGVLDPADATREGEAFFEPIEGAHFGIPWRGTTETRWLEAGVYGRIATPSRRRGGCRLEDIANDELLIVDVPRSGLRLEPNSLRCSVICRCGVLDPRTWQPFEWVAPVARSLGPRLETQRSGAG